MLLSGWEAGNQHRDAQSAQLGLSVLGAKLQAAEKQAQPEQTHEAVQGIGCPRHCPREHNAPTTAAGLRAWQPQGNRRRHATQVQAPMPPVAQAAQPPGAPRTQSSGAVTQGQHKCNPKCNPNRTARGRAWNSKLRRSTTARLTAAALMPMVGAAAASSRRRTGTWMALATAWEEEGRGGGQAPGVRSKCNGMQQTPPMQGSCKSDKAALHGGRTRLPDARPLTPSPQPSAHPPGQRHALCGQSAAGCRKPAPQGSSSFFPCPCLPPPAQQPRPPPRQLHPPCPRPRPRQRWLDLLRRRRCWAQPQPCPGRRRRLRWPACRRRRQQQRRQRQPSLLPPSWHRAAASTRLKGVAGRGVQGSATQGEAPASSTGRPQPAARAKVGLRLQRHTQENAGA